MRQLTYKEHKHVKMPLSQTYTYKEKVVVETDGNMMVNLSRLIVTTTFTVIYIHEVKRS